MKDQSRKCASCRWTGISEALSSRFFQNQAGERPALLRGWKVSPNGRKQETNISPEKNQNSDGFLDNFAGLVSTRRLEAAFYFKSPIISVPRYSL